MKGACNMPKIQCTSWRRVASLVRTGVVLTVPIATLTACASLLVEHQRFLKGWRPGRIVQIDEASSIRVRFAVDCRDRDTHASKIRAPWALIRYSQAPSRYGYIVVPLSDTTPLAIDARVEVNIHRCDAPTAIADGRLG